MWRRWKRRWCRKRPNRLRRPLSMTVATKMRALESLCARLVLPFAHNSSANATHLLGAGSRVRGLLRLTSASSFQSDRLLDQMAKIITNMKNKLKIGDWEQVEAAYKVIRLRACKCWDALSTSLEILGSQPSQGQKQERSDRTGWTSATTVRAH